MTEGTSDGRSLELFVRSLTPADGPATDHARRVRDLAGSDRISEASISVWGSEVGLATTAFRTPAGKWILDRVASFRSWADERELTMVPFFESRTVHSSVTGESYTALRLPVTCLAEYEDGELVHVAPHYDGTVACTVRTGSGAWRTRGVPTGGVRVVVGSVPSPTERHRLSTPTGTRPGPRFSRSAGRPGGTP